MEEPTHKSLSKIEKKIIKNTFLNNSNDLKFKDDTRNSFQTFPSKNSFSILPKPLDLSEVSRVSSAITTQFRISSINELDLSGVSYEISNEALENLQEIIKLSVSGSSITLPPKKLTFPCLFITSPVIIKGSPGTVIEITETSIIADFSSRLKDCLNDTEKATICEVAIIYNIDLQKQNPNAPALVLIENTSTHLELRDCELRSLNSQNGLEDFGFWINGSGYKKGSSGSSLEFNSSLLVSSCNISGFGGVCIGGVNSSIYLEKCHITGCKGNGISVMNPRELTVKKCVIDRSEKTGIDLFIFPDQPASINSPSSKAGTFAFSQSERSVLIEGNDITSSGNYGISIWSESPNHFPVSIEINNNKITKCMKEGIAIRHLNIISLNIDSNDSNLNNGTGYWLQKIGASDIRVTNNRAYNNYSGYGLYFYDTGAKTKNNEFIKNSLGGIMAVALKRNDTKLSIETSTVAGNGENGITVMDFSKGEVEIIQCQISENRYDGVHLIQNEKGTALVKIVSSSIVKNNQAGVNVVRVKCSLENSVISGNSEGDVVVAEDSRDLVCFVNEIRGEGEGEGKKGKQKKGLCSKDRCIIT